MRNWTEANWEEWRNERAAILLESGYDGPNVMVYVGTLEAIERYRLRCEALGLSKAEVETPKPKQMELGV